MLEKMEVSTGVRENLLLYLIILNGETFNFTHLTRKKGLLDKFSPGFYLTYWIVRQLYAEHPEVRYFFMGPGKYDYKPAFLAKPSVSNVWLIVPSPARETSRQEKPNSRIRSYCI